MKHFVNLEEKSGWTLSEMDKKKLTVKFAPYEIMRFKSEHRLYCGRPIIWW